MGRRPLIAVALLVGACGPLFPDPGPVEPRPGGATCAEMCDHLVSLGCEADVVECTTRCDATMDDGLNLHPECVVQVASCSQVDLASQGC